MKLTNNHGMPGPLIRAFQSFNDDYDSGGSDFSATSLLKLPRQVALQKIHKNELTEDAYDRRFALWGQAIHKIMESGKEPWDICEERLFINVDRWKISAQIDYYETETHTLMDWKATKAWAFKRTRDPKLDWVAQLNIQAEILRQNCITPKKMFIVGILPDHDERAAEKDINYPRKWFQYVEIPFWSPTEVMKFIRERIAVLVAADTALPLCPKEELWGGKRCSSYCNVSKYCLQYKQQMENNEKKRSDDQT